MKNHSQKHLTLSDRTYIEQELQQGSSFTSIANVLGKDPTTISKEIKRHRDYLKPDGFTGKCRSCMHYGECTERHVCGNDKCKYACRYCYKKNPIYHCVFYLPWNCNKPSKPPYVCNSCDRYRTCKLDRYHYSAAKAQAKYEKTLSQSREGINMTVK